MAKKVLYDNRWCQVIEKDTAVGGKWIYSHHPWCNGEGVVILPYRTIKVGDRITRIGFLGRYDVVPCHSDETELCSITGGYDNSDKFTIEQCALNELAEEGGFIGKAEDLISLGSVRPSKASDTRMYLFAIDVDKCQPCEATGDGSLGEVGAYCDWIDESQLIDSKDPLLHATYLRFLKTLIK